LHGKEKQTSQKDAFATDEHGITRKDKQTSQKKYIGHGRTRNYTEKRSKQAKRNTFATDLHGIRREIRAGSVSDGRQEDAFATDLHGKEGKRTPSVIFANAEIHIYSKARMDPRIREGDQGAE